MTSKSWPEGSQPFTNQVAGHSITSTPYGFLECNDGTLFKAVQAPPRGENEIEFYKLVFKEESLMETNDIRQLRSFLPKFFGVISTDSLRFLNLENLTHNFKHPCVSDLKIGRITYDPTATDEQKAAKIAKYRPVEQIGFQILGFRVWDAKRQEVAEVSKFTLRKMSAEEHIKNGLYAFLGGYLGDMRWDVIDQILPKLHKIRDWFKRQRTFHFYASSILLVYEGDVLPPASSPKTSILQSPSLTEVRMIDMTHVFPANGIEDENYLFGLENLIYHIEQLL